MIKILFIVTKNDVGGAQKYVTDLVNNLDKNQFKTEILFGSIGIEGEKIKHLSNASGFLFINDWLALFKLIKIYKEKKPNIIHLNSSKAGVIGTFAVFIYNLFNTQKIKTIFTAHGWVFNPDNEITTPMRWFYIFLHKIAALFQNKIICVSQYDYNLAIKYKITPLKKLITIHNGINVNKINFLSQNLARAELIKNSPRLPFNINHFPVIGSIGRLVKEKNYETLIQTATLIPEAYFFIIGDGPKYDKLQNLINQLKLQKRFIILKDIQNQQGIFFIKAFDIFVMSSIKEGLPYALLEAMAAGIPCIVTNAGGMPEIVNSGINGFVVPQKNPEALAEVIKKLITDKNLAQKFSEKAQQTITQNFTLEQMTLKTENIYKEIL